MARKKKDTEDENLNSDASPDQGDINEADDSFGLPDIEYKPLDELEETTEEASAEADEATEDSYSDETTSSTEGESSDTSEDSDNIYASTYSDDDSFGEEEEEQPQKEYIPGSYTPPKDDSKAGTIIILLVIVILAVVAAWYFGFHRPAQREKAEAAKKEQQIRQQEEAKRKQAQAQKEEEARQAELERQRQAEAEALAAEEANKEGTVETISSRTNRYYVVVASNIDGDLAMDYGKKISSESGVNVTIIEPYGDVKFHRIAVDAADTFADAQSIADELKGNYGDGVWVIKY